MRYLERVASADAGGEANASSSTSALREQRAKGVTVFSAVRTSCPAGRKSGRNPGASCSRLRAICCTPWRREPLASFDHFEQN
jgi:hypothetical protein